MKVAGNQSRGRLARAYPSLEMVGEQSSTGARSYKVAPYSSDLSPTWQNIGAIHDSRAKAQDNLLCWFLINNIGDRLNGLLNCI